MDTMATNTCDENSPAKGMLNAKICFLEKSKIAKEKRERQPNWTETEKQLLLSLTELHRSTLENKGSDTMTIKRKSQAWDEIALHMKEAGYNRSKERLKQQFGRIRSANRAKEAMSKAKPLVVNTNLNMSANGCLKLAQSNQEYNELKMNILQEELNIKNEIYCSTDDTCEEQDRNQLEEMCNTYGPELENVQHWGQDKRREHDVSATPSSAGNYSVEHIKRTKSISSMEKSDFEHIRRPVKNENSFEIRGRRVSNISPIRLSGIRVPSTREGRLRQVHMYRIAVERERIRSLKEQQRRDRIIHRKDVQIQNLKLNILRNLCNQNKENQIL